MPSFEHEALLELFRVCPELAAELLHDVFGVAVPGAPARVSDADLSQLVPMERRADVVIELGDPAAFGVIVEHQRARDERKRTAWPLYTASLHARLRCPVCLLVIALDASVAAWARRPIDTFQVGHGFRALVLGPEGTPRVDAATARRFPELAALSALAHGNAPGGAEVAVEAVAALADLDTERATLLFDIVYGSLDDAARAALEEEMERRAYTYHSDFARHYFDRGREEGREEGRHEGRVAAMRDAVVAALTARAREVTPELARRVEACDDLRELQRWLDRVLSAATPAEARAALDRES